jgi:hypothetical protein
MAFILPSGEYLTLLLRTDHTRPERWEALLACVATPNDEGFQAYVADLTDPELEGLTEQEIRGLPRADGAGGFVLVADAVAQADDEFPILVVDISDHRVLAIWAADCAQHVLHHFEQARPEDDCPRRAIDLGRAWARGEITW